VLKVEPQPRTSRGRYMQRPSGKSAKTRARKAKLQLPTRADLDGRTNTAKAFDALVSAIEADLGGADQLSAIERSLVEAYAGATITVQGINYKIALGEVIEVADLAQAISAMVRVASRLGEQRRARDVTVRSTQTSAVRLGLAAVEGEVHEN
jgi:hypothetical protein